MRGFVEIEVQMGYSIAKFSFPSSLLEKTDEELIREHGYRKEILEKVRSKAHEQGRNQEENQKD